ncbi:MAG: hypothetical protein WKF75_11045 [Singulisphaera sp.]
MPSWSSLAQAITKFPEAPIATLGFVWSPLVVELTRNSPPRAFPEVSNRCA